MNLELIEGTNVTR